MKLRRSGNQAGHVLGECQLWPSLLALAVCCVVQSETFGRLRWIEPENMTKIAQLARPNNPGDWAHVGHFVDCVVVQKEYRIK